ncbi:DNA-binding protein [Hyphomicrobium sp. 1Nfss2.1]|uniref:helix-turn-helix domain-containing protein n=1 Tax=Hyphomicrobium sp. 1Nfss2.1 TaxID=3413936 RepID=UPI003C79CDEC
MNPKHTPKLTTIEAAKVLRLSPRTLERLRVQGTGPSYMKAGRGLRARVLYAPEDLNAWIARRYASTSEYSTGVSAAHAKTA